MKKLLLIVSISLCSILSFCQESFENTLKYNETDGSPNASLPDVAWIAGHWIGEAMGGQIEEVWTPSLGGSMMGSFKFVGKEKVVFYELETISEIDSTLILRIKHFTEDLNGWEEKDEAMEFKLVKITDDAAYFDELTFKKNGDDCLDIYVVIASDTKEREQHFKYHRVK